MERGLELVASTIKGITIKIGGDSTELDKAIKDPTAQSVNLANELKQVNKLLKFDSGNVELLAQKQEILTQEVEASANKLKILKDAQAQVTQQFQNGDIGAEQYRAFQREVQQAEQFLNKYQSQLQETNAALEKHQSGTAQTASAYDKLKSTINSQESELSSLKQEYSNVVLEQGKSSKEAQELAAKMTALNSDLAANKTKMSEIEKEASDLATALNDAGNEAKESSDGFTILKGTLAELGANAIQGVIGSIKDMVGSLFELSEATAEYRSMMGKLSGSANSFGYDLDYAKGKYQELYSYVGDEQMATNAVTNLMGLGLATKDVDKLTEGAISTWAAYGDSIPIESLTESIAESINVSKVTGTLADTINWASLNQEQWNSVLGKGSSAQSAFNKAIADGEATEDAFSAALAATSSEQERANLIAGLLNTTYGQSKATYDQMNSSLIESNKAQAQLTDTQAKLGEAVEPLNTAFTNLKNQALQAMVPIVQNLVSAFTSFFNFLNSGTPQAELLKVVLIALAGALGGLLIIGTIAGMVQLLSGAFAALAGVFAIVTSPITLVIAGLTAFAAVIMHLWNTNEGFRNAVIEIWNSISSFIGGIVTGIVTWFTVTLPEGLNNLIIWFQNLPTAISQWLTQTWNDIIAWGQNLINSAIETGTNFLNGIIQFFNELPYKIGYAIGYALAQVVQWGIDLYNFATTSIPQFVETVVKFIAELPGKIWNWLVDAFNRVVQWGSQIIQKGVEAGSQFVSNVVNFITSLPGKVASLLSNVISNVVRWVSDFIGKAKTAASDFANNLINGLKSLPGKMLSIGGDIVKGIWNGITGMGDWLMGKISGFASGIVDGIKGFFGIHSPSRIMRDQVGKFISQGLAVGVEDEADAPVQAIENMGSEMLNAAKAINPVTLDRQIEHTFTGTMKTSEALMNIAAMIGSYFPELIKATDRPILLDDGTLVGRTIGKIDEQLAVRYKLKGRGV